MDPSKIKPGPCPPPRRVVNLTPINRAVKQVFHDWKVAGVRRDLEERIAHRKP